MFTLFCAASGNLYMFYVNCCLSLFLFSILLHQRILEPIQSPVSQLLLLPRGPYEGVFGKALCHEIWHTPVVMFQFHGWKKKIPYRKSRDTVPLRYFNTVQNFHVQRLGHSNAVFPHFWNQKKFLQLKNISFYFFLKTVFKTSKCHLTWVRFMFIFQST